MSYKRKNWHSGLTYKNVCKACQCVVVYNDFQLCFRPWFADGFVYCPRCETPLRHSEALAIDANGNPLRQKHTEAPRQNIHSDGTFAYCKNCGNRYNIGAVFCSSCGKKLSDM